MESSSSVASLASIKRSIEGPVHENKVDLFYKRLMYRVPFSFRLSCHRAFNEGHFLNFYAAPLVQYQRNINTMLCGVQVEDVVFRALCGNYDLGRNCSRDVKQNFNGSMDSFCLKRTNKSNLSSARKCRRNLQVGGQTRGNALKLIAIKWNDFELA